MIAAAGADPTTWPKAFAALVYGGRLVTVGAHGGARSRSMPGGFTSTAWAWSAPIDAVMPLVWLPEAFTLIGEERVTGRLVIDPSLP